MSTKLPAVPSADSDPPSRTELDKVLSNRIIGISAVLLILIATGMGWLLLARFGVGLEAVKTLGTIVLGTGGSIGLLLAARRQQTAERDLVEKRRDLAHKERVQLHTEKAQYHVEKVAADTLALQQRVSAATEADAAARRITDSYTKAVEQLGSDKAQVRLADLYALERLAQDVETQRQTIVNVLCAYLRMPYDPEPPTEFARDFISDGLSDNNQLVTPLSRDEIRGYAQEKQVRIAAQRILGARLRPSRNLNAFWQDIDLDITGATLFDFNLEHTHLRSLQCRGATFIGDTEFNGSEFLGNINFEEAKFLGNAIFIGSRFSGNANFERTTFALDARFDVAQFLHSITFAAAIFVGDARFDMASFSGNVRFDKALFARDARLYGARAQGHTNTIWPQNWRLAEEESEWWHVELVPLLPPREDTTPE